MTSKLKYLVASGVISAAMMSASSAIAAGTAPGTDVTNTVTVDFTVGGVNQTDITSNTDTFDVDRVLRFTVVEDTSGTRAGDTSVVPGQTGAETYFVVTNTSKDAIDVALGVVDTDTNNIISGVTYFVESGATPGYQPAEDTATFIDELGADQSRVVYVIRDVSAAATNGQNADVTLTGTVHVAGAAGLGTQYSLTGSGAALVSDDSDVNTAGTETIFGDAGRDGAETATDGYTISAANLTVFKSSRVISDPFSSSNPKAVPGAVVEYCIAVSNGAGAATASGVAISDILDMVKVDYSPSTIFVNATVADFNTATQTCSGGTTRTDAAGDADGGSFTGTATADTGTATVAGTIPTLAASTTLGVRFQVVID